MNNELQILSEANLLLIHHYSLQKNISFYKWEKNLHGSYVCIDFLEEKISYRYTGSNSVLSLEKPIFFLLKIRLFNWAYAYEFKFWVQCLDCFYKNIDYAFRWISTLFSKARVKKLEENDLYDLSDEDSAIVLTNKLQR